MPLPENFLEDTKLLGQDATDQMKGHKSPPLEMPHTKELFSVELPAPELSVLPPLDLSEAINNRRSHREHAPDEITLKELSGMLWSTQGVKRATNAYTMRTVPSAGARHPFETFISLHRVAGVEKGLYRYIATEHKLSCLAGQDLSEEFTQACLGQDFIAKGALLMVWVADSYRMSWRYGPRSFRYIFIEAGHLCQNLYLAAEALGCGCCAIGAFDDDKLNRLLGIDGKRTFTVYLASIGKRA